MAEGGQTGRVLIFCGPGKGKTVAAFGVALRAAGHGMRTLVAQFVKHEECGEHAAARNSGGLIEVRLGGTGFLPDEGSPPPEAVRKARKTLAEAASAMAAGDYGLVVLDEVLYALRRGLLAVEEVRGAVEGRAAGVHVILTGDGPHEPLADLADTITEMRCVRHPFRQGRPPTAGIEF